MFRNPTRFSQTHVLSALLALALLLSACGTSKTAAPTATQPQAVETQPVPNATQTAAGDTYPAPVNTQPVTADTYPAPGDTQPATGDTYPAPGDASGQTPAGTVSLTLDGVAQSYNLQSVGAVLGDAGEPYWLVLPEHRVLTLAGYPVSAHTRLPEVFVYPVAELAAANEAAAKVIADLQALLKSKQAGEDLPSLPLVNAAQMLHAQVSYLDFASGSGVRYLTQFAQGIVPVNNAELIYTFQGLTSDGKYYIAAVLPVTLPDLPADSTLAEQDATAFAENYQTYLAETAAALDSQPASAFTPDLSALDALVQSITVK